MGSSSRIILFGSTGTLGTALLAELAPAWEVITPSRADVDLSMPGAAAQYLASGGFSIVINAAGWTDVDACESAQEKAMQINAHAVGEMARASRRAGARLIHFGSDYVFPGTTRHLLEETDAVEPINHYGRSKLEGERQVFEADERALVVRLSWLFGSTARGFVAWVLTQASKENPFSVVADKWSCPTGSRDIARDIVPLIADPSSCGILHYSNRDVCTWHEWATHIIETGHRLGLIERPNFPAPTTLDKIFSGKAQRPVYTPLHTGSFEERTGISPRPWRDALDEHLSELAVPA